MVLPGASAVHAQEPDARGVVVVALPGGTDAAWPIAKALYGKHGLLPPGLGDAEARVLAGEEPPAQRIASVEAKEGQTTAEADESARATSHLRLLARLRDEASQEPTRRAALIALTKETHARAVVLVGAAAGITVSRTFSAETGTLGDALTSPSNDLAIDKIAQEAHRKSAPKTQVPAFLKSPWTWVAVGAAAVLGTSVYLLSRTENASTSVPLRLRTDR
jgi:hypothetical protein